MIQRSQFYPITISLVIVLVHLMLAGSAWSGIPEKGNDWPGWRGPNMDATVSDAGVLEQGQNYQLKVVWRKALGTGYSAVSIVGGTAITMFSDGTADYVTALNADDGAELWRFKIDSTYLGRFGSQNGPVSTPLIADDKVFALGPRGQLFALNSGTGEKLWSANLVETHASEPPFYGFTTSPLVYNDALIVETGGPENRAIAAFDKNTGASLWSVGNDKILYQSPAITTLHERQQLLCVGGQNVYGLAPESGELLWQYEHQGRGGGFGSASMNPVILPDNQIFLTYKSSESILVQLTAVEGKQGVQEVWRTKGLKRSYTVPVYHDGYLYGYNAAFLSCIDAATGETMWKSRQPGDGFAIVVDGHLVITTKKGGLSVGEASPAGYSEIAGLALSDNLCWTPPSFANGRIYARNHGEVACVEILPTDQIAKAEVEQRGVLPGSEFAKFVAQAQTSDNKTALIDAFMAKQESFPIIEGDDMAHFVFRGQNKEMDLGGELFGYEAETPMNHVSGSNLFYYSTRLEPNARLGYEFIDDSLKHLTDPLNPETESIPFVGKVSMLAMPAWTEPDHLKERAGAAQGRVDSLTFTSTVSDSIRTLEVYLPVGYDSGDSRYPVAYVHGSIGQSKLPVTLNNIVGKTVEPVVVVFIPRIFRGGYSQYIGQRRDVYARIFIEEIMPLVEREYRIAAAPESRANVGAMYGGFMAFYTSFKNPGLFGKLGMQTPYWDPDEEGKHSQMVTRPDKQALAIYFDWGKYDPRAPLEGWDFGEYAESFARLLNSGGYDFQGGEVNEGFGQTSWRNRSDKLFETLYPLKSAEAESTTKTE